VPRLRPEDLIQRHPEHDFLIADSQYASPYMSLAHNAFYEFAAHSVKGLGRVLDAGCGTGFGTAILATSARLAVAVDVKPILVQYARQEYEQPGLHVAAMDACRLGFTDDSFDAIVADELLEHLPEYLPFLDEAVRVLQPGGLFVCATVNRAHTFGAPTNPLNPHHFFEFDENDFRSELSRYFSEVELLGQGFGEQFERYNQHAAARAIEWLLVRLRVKQWLSPRLRMRVRSWLTGSDPGGDGDAQFVVSGENVDQAFYLVALCRGPRATDSSAAGTPA